METLKEVHYWLKTIIRRKKKRKRRRKIRKSKRNEHN
jgi:hypothetical protein